MYDVSASWFFTSRAIKVKQIDLNNLPKLVKGSLRLIVLIGDCVQSDKNDKN